MAAVHLCQDAQMHAHWEEKNLFWDLTAGAVAVQNSCLCVQPFVCYI